MFSTKWIKPVIIVGLLFICCFVTWKVTDRGWQIKWQERQLAEAKQQKKWNDERQAIEADWNKKFADIQSWYQTELEKNRNEADKTIANYRAGNLRLHKKFTCLNSYVSDTATPRQISDATRGCGLQDRDVEFLIRYSERAQQIVIKYNKAVKNLDAIYGVKDEK